jgi:hypothetical protein
MPNLLGGGLHDGLGPWGADILHILELDLCAHAAEGGAVARQQQRDGGARLACPARAPAPVQERLRVLRQIVVHHLR